MKATCRLSDQDREVRLARNKRFYMDDSPYSTRTFGNSNPFVVWKYWKVCSCRDGLNKCPITCCHSWTKIWYKMDRNPPDIQVDVCSTCKEGPDNRPHAPQLLSFNEARPGSWVMLPRPRPSIQKTSKHLFSGIFGSLLWQTRGGYTFGSTEPLQDYLYARANYRVRGGSK